ncbi:MAG: hypothetical protein NC318_12010 [Blautia sp.]|nr:hypothetical protein [Blautia sp.]
MQEKENEIKQLAAARQWAAALCQYAGVDEAFYEQFWRNLSQSEAVYREFVYYLENQTFLCAYRVAGYTIVDIMVWQMDHFKAYLDRGQDDMKQNGDKMLLMAFDTMLKMEKEPEEYVRKMQSETGTDYPDKY